MEKEPSSLRQFDELTLPERYTALRAAQLEETPRELLIEWIGVPPGVKPDEIPTLVSKLDEQRQAQIAQHAREGKPLPTPTETFKKLKVDGKSVHGQIAKTALKKIPGF